MSQSETPVAVETGPSRTMLGLGFAIATIIADQAHKLYMLEVTGIQYGERRPFLPFLDLVFVKNTGVSYGWLSLDSMAGQYALAGFAVVASIVLTVWLTRVYGKVLAISLGLIIGGAIGNAIDRVRIGGVADFFSFHIGDFHWYVFNIADVAIVAGVIGLLYDSIVLSRKSAANSA